MGVCGCVCVCMNCNNSVYIYIFILAIHQLSHARRRKGWLKYYYCYAQRARGFRPSTFPALLFRFVLLLLFYTYLYACINRFRHHRRRRRRRLCSRSIRFIVYLWLHVFSAIPRSLRIKTAPITWFPIEKCV